MAKPLTILKRFGHKGQFVKYPSKWQKRMAHTGKRRFDTSCDLIVGVCSCGERHDECEGWIEESLEMHRQRVETHAEWLARTREEKKT